MAAPTPETVDGLAPLPGGAGTAPGSAPPLPTGTQLADGRYELGAPLGRGGFGVTYAATDTRLRRPVAIKELLPDGARRVGTEVRVAGGAQDAFVAARARFLREATTLARFGHPNIVRIFAVFEENGTAYLVLERLVGRTLGAELRARQGPLTEAEALEVAGHVAAALAAVHRAGVLHRDVSPANLIRTDDGRTVLIDFGLARPFAPDKTTMMTRIVTPGYAPPEQHDGTGRFSARADVYALGATLHRLLSGATPPAASARRAGDPLTPLWRLNPTVSRRTSDAVTAALALDPAERPPSVTDLIDRLGVDRGHLDLVAPDDADEADEADEALIDLTVAPTVAVGSGPSRAPLLQKRPAPPAHPPRPAPFAPTSTVRADDRSGTSWRPVDVPAAARPDEVRTEMVAPQHGSWVVPAPTEADAVAPRPAPAPHPDPRQEVPAGGEPGGAVGGRRWVTVPLGLAAVALTSAQPVTLTLVLGLVVAPLLATVGDVLAQPDRSPAWAPLWWMRNVGVGLVRSLGALVVLAIGVCLWFGADAFDALRDLGPWVLRLTGVASASLLVLSMARGGAGFRSDVALDALARRVVPRGRPTVAAAVVILVGGAVAAAGLALQPEPWPLG